MRPIVSSLVVVAALGTAHAASAQRPGSDVDYCRTLARAYLKQNPVQASPVASDAMLPDNCTSSPQATTDILKQKFAQHGIDLPKPAVAGGE